MRSSDDSPGQNNFAFKRTQMPPQRLRKNVDCDTNMVVDRRYTLFPNSKEHTCDPTLEHRCCREREFGVRLSGLVSIVIKSNQARDDSPRNRRTRELVRVHFDVCLTCKGRCDRLLVIQKECCMHAHDLAAIDLFIGVWTIHTLRCCVRHSTAYTKLQGVREDTVTRVFSMGFHALSH